VKDPGQTYPRALAISIILVVLTYAAPTLIGIYYIPDKEEWEDGVFVEVGEEVGGAWLRDWMGFAGVVSSLAILCTMLCTTARMLEGMANTGNMPQMFANLHSKVRVAPPTLHAGSSSTLQWPPRTPYASVL
jgi:amino acid transporter